MIGIDEQIACVAREIALRKNVYPKFVASGRMKQGAADQELARMEAVIETLKTLLWIPVTVRLPDDDVVVMLQMEDGEVWTGFHDGDNGWYYVSADPAHGVKAWRGMPA